MKIKVKYFASMREATGVSEEIIDTNALTPSQVFSFIKEKYNFSFEESHLKVALNEEYADFNSSLSELDTIVFIPPVAGG